MSLKRVKPATYNLHNRDYIYSNIEYCNASDLIEEVKNKLSSFFEQNSMDESVLYARIRYCLSKLKMNHAPQKFTVVEVENCKAELPEDFRKLKLALACFQEKARCHSRFEETVYTEEQHVCELNLCESACDVCHDECGNMYKIVQKFDRPGLTYTHSNFELLCPTKQSSPSCAKDCLNMMSRNKNEIDIRNGHINTNFDSGMIYIEYVAEFETADDYLIPDNETIKEWIKADMVHELVQTLYWNGEPNMERRYADMKQDLFVKAENARMVYKASEFQEFYNMSNTFIRRFNRYRMAIWDECYYSAPSTKRYE